MLGKVKNARIKWSSFCSRHSPGEGVAMEASAPVYRAFHDGSRSTTGAVIQVGEIAVESPVRIHWLMVDLAGKGMRPTEDIFQDELCAWLALHHAPGLQPQAALTLVETAGSAVAALWRLRSAPPVDLEPAGAWLDSEAVSLCAEVKSWVGPDRRVLVYSDPCYPRLLRQLVDPPLALYVAGDVNSLSRQQVAVIGSRSSSGAGLRIAGQFAATLARTGLVVTAGLAVGIDGSAHRGALAAGGETIAVLGSGLKRIYPGTHSRLAVELAAAGGALVSEFSLEAAPLPRHFPQRNRLISGLSLGVVVVEASLRSGSLITARHALDQGRELFAVPGSIHNPLARGCHRLLRDGACLVESAADILEELGLPAAPAPVPARTKTTLPASLQVLLRHVGFSPVTPEALVESSGLTIAEISSMLIDLEIRGYVCSQNDGNYCRIR